jgi:hypothetical protein
MITKLFPHHAPHCSLGLVAVKLVFGHLFEALQRLTQAAQINTSVRLTLSQPKDFGRR